MKKLFSLVLALTMLLAVPALAEDTVNVILNAGTTQAFGDAPVSDADLETIVKAGLATASAINQQPWHFVVITDPAVMEEISKSGGMPAGMPAGGPPAGAPAGGPPAGMPAMPAGGGAAKAALGDSPAAIVIYMNRNTASPDASFDCGMATQNMVITAEALGLGTKIVSSPTMSLNGENHDALCRKLGVDPAFEAVAVLLVGYDSTDAVTSASVRSAMEEKVSFVK